MNEEALLAELERAKGGAAPHVIEAALRNPSWMVRKKASEMAADHIPLDKLLGYVSQGGDYALRAGAMEALAHAGTRALEIVIHGAQSQNPDTALFSIQILAKIDAPEARQFLRDACTHEDVLVAQAAIEAIGEQRDPEAVSVLIDLLSEDREILEMDPWRAISAIIALGKIQSAEALGSLLALRASDLFRDTVDEAIGSIRRANPMPV